MNTVLKVCACFDLLAGAVLILAAAIYLLDKAARR